MIELAQLTKLLACSDEASWSTTLFSLAREQGFDQVLFGAVGSKHARFEAAFLHSNYSPAWRQRYDAEKMYWVDPVIAHCLVSSLPLIWGPGIACGSEQRQFYEQASAYGIRCGVTFPIHGPNGEFGVLSYASSVPPDTPGVGALEQSMPALALLRDYAFASSLRFISARNGAEPAPHLTRRELEVLNWVMVGKSSWEISMITNCSEATVNFHIANIRQKFNVNTRQQALVKAIAMGIISPEDPHR